MEMGGDASPSASRGTSALACKRGGGRGAARLAGTVAGPLPPTCRRRRPAGAGGWLLRGEAPCGCGKPSGGRRGPRAARPRELRLARRRAFCLPPVQPPIEQTRAPPHLWQVDVYRAPAGAPGLPQPRRLVQLLEVRLGAALRPERQVGLHLVVRHPMSHPYHGRRDLVVAQGAVGGERRGDAERAARRGGARGGGRARGGGGGGGGSQAEGAARQGLGEHRDRAKGEVEGARAGARLGVQRRAYGGQAQLREAGHKGSGVRAGVRAWPPFPSLARADAPGSSQRVGSATCTHRRRRPSGSSSTLRPSSTCGGGVGALVGAVLSTRGPREGAYLGTFARWACGAWAPQLPTTKGGGRVGKRTVGGRTVGV